MSEEIVCVMATGTEDAGWYTGPNWVSLDSRQRWAADVRRLASDSVLPKLVVFPCRIPILQVKTNDLPATDGVSRGKTKEDEMESFKQMPGRQVSPRASFAAGALVGAIAVFVPFASSGHPDSRGEGASRSPVASTSAPVTASNGADAGLAASIRKNSSTSNEPSSEPTCDVQLD
jgi:hypothetical protein